MNERDKAALKDSGIQWVGLIPKEWDVIRLKNSVEGCFNGIWGDDPDEGLFDTPCIRVADFDRTKNSVSLKKLTMRKIELASSNPRFLKHGDLLIEKSGGGEQSPVGNVVIFNHTFKAVCSNFVGRLPVRSQHSSHYWNFVHQSIYAIRLNTCSIKQNTGIQNLDTTQYLDERVPAPPLSEQRQIAAYLNRETAKLDELIAKQQKLIKLLQEKRQAVISQAVTKGIDPNVKMKDSGVEWLGEVPEHWRVVKVKHLVTSIASGTSVNSESHPASTDEFAVLKTSSVYGGYFSPNENKKVLQTELDRVSCPLRKDTLIVSRMNTPDLVGSAGYCDFDSSTIFLPDRLWQVHFNSGLAKYCYLWTLSASYRDQVKAVCSGTSSSMQNLAQGDFLGFSLVLPTEFSEIQRLINHVDFQLKKLEFLSLKAMRSTELLKEHRQALIMAAVTGKIDVRGLVTDEEVAALDAELKVETTEEDFESEVVDADYITEEE